jgi:hypothetical protein
MSRAAQCKMHSLGSEAATGCAFNGLLMGGMVMGRLFSKSEGKNKSGSSLEAFLSSLTYEGVLDTYGNASEENLRLPSAITMNVLLTTNTMVAGIIKMIREQEKKFSLKVRTLPYDSMAFEVAAYCHAYLEWCNQSGDDSSFFEDTPFSEALNVSSIMISSFVTKKMSPALPESALWQRSASYLMYLNLSLEEAMAEFEGNLKYAILQGEPRKSKDKHVNANVSFAVDIALKMAIRIDHQTVLSSLFKSSGDLCLDGPEISRERHQQHKKDDIDNFPDRIDNQERDHLVRIPGKRWIIQKGNGSSIFAFPPQFVDASPFIQGLAAVCFDDEKYGFINPDGAFVIEPQFDFAGMNFSEGLAAVMVDEQWGYVDRNGRMVIEPKYEEAGQFTEGLAAVSSEDYVYGYIDKEGKYAIKPRFDHAEPFSESLARIRNHQDRLYGYIDLRGRQVIASMFEENYYHRAGKFSQGLAAVRNGGKSGYLDNTGRFVIEPKFDGFIHDFADGLASVSIDGKLVYIDRTGTPIVITEFYDGEAFSNGLAAVCQRDYEAEERYKKWAEEQYRTQGILCQGPNPMDYLRWGYIDRTGELVISILFNRATSFSEGFAAVRIGEKWAYVSVPRAN